LSKAGHGTIKDVAYVGLQRGTGDQDTLSIC
jgi:hypothetical protein